jgi:hypothetical protein
MVSKLLKYFVSVPLATALILVILAAYALSIVLSVPVWFLVRPWMGGMMSGTRW